MAKRVHRPATRRKQAEKRVIANVKRDLPYKKPRNPVAAAQQHRSTVSNASAAQPEVNVSRNDQETEIARQERVKHLHGSRSSGVQTMYPAHRIRNFSVIAHVDHGKSSLVDRLLQYTRAVQERDMQEQFLDNMDLERERGITIKLQTSRLTYYHSDGQEYVLQLVDTPGHVDFSYEVSRSLAACEGALLVVDASQGVEAQTVANVYLALENDLELIPIINKCDLPQADPEGVAREIEEVIGLDCSNAIFASAKSGLGIEETLDAIVEQIPSPKAADEDPLRALIFDSYYDPYKGVIVYFRIREGTLRKGESIRFFGSGKEYTVEDLGVIAPNKVSVDVMGPGEVGFLSAHIKQVSDARVGDTITSVKRPAEQQLEGYQEARPMVFCGLFTTVKDNYEDLREALEKLQLNDSALTFEPETSTALGFGFRVGFLGLLHLEIIQERLEREYGLDLVTTAPTVRYQVIDRNGERHEVENPTDMPSPEKRAAIEEPFARMDILTPSEFVGKLMELCHERRGEFKTMNYINPTRASLSYDIPLAEIVTDFFDQVKSRSKGYASMEYNLLGYRKSDLVRLDVKVNGNLVEPLSTILHRDKAHSIGRRLCKKLAKRIERHNFKIPIQAAIGGTIIASEHIPALRKDVLSKCYGGDVSRKKKLLAKQAEGKKRMAAMGNVDVSQDALMSIISINDDDDD